MSDSEETKKLPKPKKQKAEKGATSSAIAPDSAISFAQEAGNALEQLRAPSIPTYAFSNPLKNLAPFKGMKDLMEMNRGISEAMYSSSIKQIRDMMKNLNSVREATTLSKTALELSETLRSFSHNPAKDALKQMSTMSQMVHNTAYADSMRDILNSFDSLHKSSAVSAMAAEASAALRDLSINPIKDMVRSLDCWNQAETVNHMALKAVAGCSLAASPSLSVAKMLDPAHDIKTAVSQMTEGVSAAWRSLSVNPLKDILKELSPLHQMKTVSQMAQEASVAMFGITNPMRTVAKEFKAASEIAQSMREMHRSLVSNPLSHSANTLRQLKEIRDSITDLPISSRASAFGDVHFTAHLKAARPAFSEGVTAKTAREAALDMAANISAEAVTPEAEKLFTKEDLKEVVTAFRELLLAETSQQQRDVVNRFSDSKAFKFLLNVFISILSAYIFLCATQLKREIDIHSRSVPAIEYVMHSSDKPHVGIARREGGVRVYERPDKRSVPVYKFIDGEFIALMWDRRPGWRMVAYEIDLGRMKALKVGWIQDSDYDRTNMPVRSLFLKLYSEQ